jgi:TIR domain
MATRISIEPLFGRRAGQNIWLPPKDVLSFGRDSSCTVVFPADLTVVAPIHLVLLRTKTDEWVIGPLNGRFVAVDGKQVDTGATLPLLSCKIELGHLGGPSFWFRKWISLGASEEPVQPLKTSVNEPLAISELANRRLSAQVCPTGLPSDITPSRPAVPAPAAPPPVSAPSGVRSLRISSLYWLAKVASILFRYKIAPEPIKKQIDIPEEQTDIVDVSAFAPDCVRAGEYTLIQIFIHLVDDATVAMSLARETDSTALRRGVATLISEVKRGQRIDISLEATGLTIDEPFQSIVWRGAPRSCQFLALVPTDTADRQVHVRVNLRLENLPIGVLVFALQVTEAQSSLSNPASDLRGDWARRYQYAFLSYASADRSEVLKRAQALKAVRINFFHDLLSIDPGEQWLPKLFQEIDRCDLFLLFWSTHAANSEWVRRESEHALNRRKKSDLPDIAPIILEFPVPPPPESMKDIHFNDYLRYIMAAVDAELALVSQAHA